MLKDLVREGGTSPSTGTYNLSGATGIYRTFLAAFGAGQLAYYFARYADPGAYGYAWECGVATVSSGPARLTAATMRASSTGSAISWNSSAQLVIYCEAPAALMPHLGADPSADKLAYFSAASATMSLTDLTGYARTLIAAASASAARTVLGLGSAAVLAVGTSGSVLGKLDTANTWSASQTFAATTYLGAAAGAESLRAIAVASAVNRVEAQGGATGINTSLGVVAAGADSSIFFNLYGKGSSGIRLWGNGAEQARVGTTASAVNFFLFEGGATAIATAPAITATGSDSNVWFNVISKGGNGYRFWANSAEQMRVGAVASSVNYWQITGSATGTNPGLSVAGSDSSVTASIFSKGSAGTVDLATNSNGNVQLRALHTASVVNIWTVTGAATGGPPQLAVQGSDTNANAIIASKGSGILALYGNGAEQMRIGATSNAVNFFRIDGAVTAGQPTLTATGSDSNVASKYVVKGTASQFFYANGGSDILFRLSPAGSSINYITAEPAATGVNAAPDLFATGADADVWFNVYGKGTSGFRAWINSAEQFRVSGPASAVNRITAVGSVTGGYPTFTANLSIDTNAGLDVITKGSAPMRVYTNGGTLQSVFAHTASAVNYTYQTGATTNNAVVYGADGSDATIPVLVRAKGAGAVSLTSVTDGTMLSIGRWGSGSRVAFIVNGTAPSVAPTGGAYLWAEGGAIKAMGPSGTITTLSAA